MPSTDVDPTPIPGFVRELLSLDVSMPGGATAKLEALVTRPVQPARVPLVLVNHGNPRDAASRSKMTPTALAALSMAFARRGYGVAVVMRQGYGRSTGNYVETIGPCNDMDYGRAAHALATEIVATLVRLQRESWVDPNRVVLLGISAGGYGALAAGASNPRGAVGVISFAGGRGSDLPDHVCQPERLVAALRVLGGPARLPSLWIYAQNDRFFAPTLAAKMRDAYASGGSRAELLIAPAFGDDGHRLALAPPGVWWKHVVPFLQHLGLPTAFVLPAAPTTLRPPPSLGKAGQSAFDEYVSSEGFEKAFAVGESHWGWAEGARTRNEAAEAAIARCERQAKKCVVYALGNDYAR